MKMKFKKKIFLASLASFALFCLLSSCTANVVSKSENEIKSGGNAMSVKIKYMGQGTARITTEDNKVIYIDPYAGDDYSAAADLILETHDHFDHSQLDLVSNRNADCKIITEKDALVNGEHKTFDLPFVKVIAVEAGNNKNHDINKCVGYVLEFKNGMKVYFSGDTSKTKQMSEMASMNIDYAFFCTDGKYNMGNEEAAECAKLVNAKHNIPYHNDPGEGIHFNRKLAEEWTAPNKLIVDVNEEIVLK